MPTDSELMQQVLDEICGARLCEVNSMSNRQEMLRLLDKAAEVLRARLAQPEPVPVAWRWKDVDGYETIMSVKPPHGEAEPLYAAPLQTNKYSLD